MGAKLPPGEWFRQAICDPMKCTHDRDAGLRAHMVRFLASMQDTGPKDGAS